MLPSDTQESLRRDVLINAALLHFHATSEAERLEPLMHGENPAVALSADGSNYGGQIQEDALAYARIAVNMEGEAPEYRYFKKLASVDGTKRSRGPGEFGFSGSAWVEVEETGHIKTDNDGKCALRLCYPGYTGDLPDGTAQSSTVIGTALGLYSMNPQARGELMDFLARVHKQVEEGELSVGTATISGHSLGAANALVTHLYCQGRDIPCQTITSDPLKARAVVNHLADRMHGTEQMRAILNGKHYTKQDIRDAFTAEKGVVTVLPVIKEIDHETGESAPAPKGFLAKFAEYRPHKFGPVGQIVHMDLTGMEDVRREDKIPLGDMTGPGHSVVNIIHHLFQHGPDALQPAGTAQNPARGRT